MPILAITPMRLDDLDEIDRLELRSFASPWSTETYRRELTRNKLSHYRVVRPLAGTAAAHLPPILAYGGCWLLDYEAHIMTLATHPDWLRCKLGEWLLLYLIDEIQQAGGTEISLEVRQSNLAAQQLYISLGFVEVGERKRYYPPAGDLPGEDALILTLYELDQERVRLPLESRLKAAEAEANRRLTV